MRAVVFRNRDLTVKDVPDPTPGEGQVLVKTLSCGICASDVHALHHAEHMVEAARRSRSNFIMDLERDLVFGHEFCAEVVENGKGTQGKFKPGTRVSSIPLAISKSATSASVEPIGFSNNLPGGFAEYMVLNELLLTEVPNGLPTHHATLTEPMAVGWHATERARLTRKDVPLVIGCGPVGLAVVAALKIRGIRPIITADFSPRRRKLAEMMGADIVVDPGVDSPYDKWIDVAAPDGFDPRSVEAILGLGRQPRPGVIFECVGVPGVIQQIIEGAPREARIVVVGICMQRDHFDPFCAIEKQVNVQFVIGNTPEEFAQSLHHIAEGAIEVGPLITNVVGAEQTKAAFADMEDIEHHTKILMEPWR